MDNMLSALIPLTRLSVHLFCTVVMMSVHIALEMRVAFRLFHFLLISKRYIIVAFDVSTLVVSQLLR